MCQDGDGTKCRKRYPTNFRRVTNAAIGLKTLGLVGTADLGISLAVISLQVCGSVLCRKRWFKAAAMASRFDSSSSWSNSAVDTIRGAFSRLQLPDGFHQSFNRDVQWLCSSLEVHFATPPWPSLLSHVVLELTRTLQSTSVTVRAKHLRPIEMHSSTCCLWASFVPTCTFQFSLDPLSLGFASDSPNSAAKFLFRLRLFATAFSVETTSEGGGLVSSSPRTKVGFGQVCGLFLG